MRQYSSKKYTISLIVCNFSKNNFNLEQDISSYRHEQRVLLNLYKVVQISLWHLSYIKGEKYMMILRLYDMRENIEKSSMRRSSPILMQSPIGEIRMVEKSICSIQKAMNLRLSRFLRDTTHMNAGQLSICDSLTAILYYPICRTDTRWTEN